MKAPDISDPTLCTVAFRMNKEDHKELLGIAREIGVEEGAFMRLLLKWGQNSYFNIVEKCGEESAARFVLAALD